MPSIIERIETLLREVPANQLDVADIAPIVVAAVEEEREACAKECESLAAGVKKEAEGSLYSQQRSEFLRAARAHEFDAEMIRGRRTR